MAFFEQLEKKISETSQGAIKRGKEFSDITKLNSVIAASEKTVNTLYLQFGKFVFENGFDELNLECANLLNEIKQQLWQISKYRGQVKTLKGLTSCQNCGADVSYGALFCSVCGGKMDITPPENAAECPKCGKQVKTEQKFCTGCGHSLTQNAPEPEQPVPSMDFPPQPALLCPVCDSPITQNSIFCNKCGTSLS